MDFGNVLIISTHFDDAPLSLGGVINRIELFQNLHVLTVFTRSSYTILTNIPNSVDYISTLRNLEMENYCHELNIKLHTLGFCDTTQRKYPSLEIYKETIATFLNTVNPEKDDIFDNVKLELDSKIKKIKYDSIFFPLAIGNHLDHLIVHRIAKSLSMENKRVYFYEDLPYAADYEMEYIEWIANKRLDSPHFINVDITGEIKSKIMQLEIFESQLTQRDLDFVYYHSLRLCQSNRYNYERLWYE